MYGHMGSRYLAKSLSWLCLIESIVCGSIAVLKCWLWDWLSCENAVVVGVVWQSSSHAGVFGPIIFERENSHVIQIRIWVSSSEVLRFVCGFGLLFDTEVDDLAIEIWIEG